MDDLISRQAVLDEMKNMYHAAESWGREATDDIIKARAESCMASLVEMKLRVENLPSAKPERKKGKWIEDAKTYYEQLNERGLMVDEYTPYFVDDIACSKCLAKFSVIDNETQFFKFCPNCGTDMRGEQE